MTICFDLSKHELHFTVPVNANVIKNLTLSEANLDSIFYSLNLSLSLMHGAKCFVRTALKRAHLYFHLEVRTCLRSSMATKYWYINIYVMLSNAYGQSDVGCFCTAQQMDNLGMTFACMNHVAAVVSIWWRQKQNHTILVETFPGLISTRSAPPTAASPPN